MMNWWFKLGDKVVEQVTNKTNNRGSIKFRNKMMNLWFAIWSLLGILGLLGSAWSVAVPLLVIFLTAIYWM